MRLLAIAVVCLSVFCGCSSEARKTNEVESILAGLTGPPIWLQTNSSLREVSNKLVQLKHVAVPILLRKLSNLNYQNQAELQQLGLACSLLGTNAYPVLNEVVKGLASKEFFKCGNTTVILQLAGPVSFGPVIEFSKSNVKLDEPNLIKEHISYLTEGFPVESLGELVRLYHVTGGPASVREYITLAFREVIMCEDAERLIPTLKALLAEQDEFLVVETLGFIKRCNRLPVGLKEDVTRLLESPRAEIRTAATNVVNFPLQQAKETSK